MTHKGRERWTGSTVDERADNKNEMSVWDRSPHCVALHTCFQEIFTVILHGRTGGTVGSDFKVVDVRKVVVACNMAPSEARGPQHEPW
jgi:hypothetical protein